MQNRLKSCPFCGSKDLRAIPMNAFEAYVTCASCGAKGPYVTDKVNPNALQLKQLMVDAENKWNKRVDNDVNNVNNISIETNTVDNGDE